VRATVLGEARQMRVTLVGDDPLTVHGMEAVLLPNKDIDIVVAQLDVTNVHRPIEDRFQADIFVVLVSAVDRDVVAIVRQLISMERRRLVPVLVLAERLGAHSNEILELGSCVAQRRFVGATEMLALIRLVAAGYLLVERSHARHLAASAAGLTPHRLDLVALGQLTRREHEVFELMTGGKSNTEIADILSVARSTVKSHVERIFAKLEIHDRVQLALLAAARQGADGNSPPPPAWPVPLSGRPDSEAP
jgi:DNA-binding NarL/FixJ family response regulator